jgi:GDP-4-dehydro-6-deoxy-D-mannose reductase
MGLGEAGQLMYSKGMSKIVVTGANGFVGQHLLRELVASGYEVICISGTQTVPLANTKGRENITLDLMKPEDAERIDFSDVTGVIHLAGMAAVGPSFDSPLQYITTNIGLEVNLFQAAIGQKATPRFIIISSGSLYDPAAELPITESSPVLPNSPYAVSKLGQEQMARYYASRGFEVIIARPFNHIGPGQGSGFIVPDITEQIVAAEHGETNKILVGNLEAQRDYTDVRDIARAYRLLIEKGIPGKTYNVCSGAAHSGQELLDSLLKSSTVDPEIEQDATKMRPADNPIIYGDHGSLTNDTGWQPTINLSTTLKDVLIDWRSR